VIPLKGRLRARPEALLHLQSQLVGGPAELGRGKAPRWAARARAVARSSPPVKKPPAKLADLGRRAGRRGVVFEQHVTIAHRRRLVTKYGYARRDERDNICRE
jgi:hypothetical protein